jgi:hypothetical protein
VSGLWEVHGNRRLVHRRERHGDADRIDFRVLNVAVVLVDRDKPLRVCKSWRLCDRRDAGERRNDQREGRLQDCPVAQFDRGSCDSGDRSRGAIGDVARLELTLEEPPALPIPPTPK